MNIHEVNGIHNGKLESVKNFSELGIIILIWVYNEQSFYYFMFFFCVDKDAQELINAAIEARKFSYRYVKLNKVRLYVICK